MKSCQAQIKFDKKCAIHCTGLARLVAIEQGLQDIS